MGTVHRAFHTRLRRSFALKTIVLDRQGQQSALDRFRREVEMLGRLEHPHIVHATDAGEVGGQPYLVMELIDGIDLARLLALHGPLTQADACELCRQAAEGLDYIQRQGLVHRDIKPSNLLLARGGQLKILDLGVARGSLEGIDHTTMTIPGQVLGTADYMAPEQGLMAHQVDIRADLYSLGCTLFFLLTGKALFSHLHCPSLYHKIKAHVEAEPPSLRMICPGVDQDLALLVTRLLAKNPEQRPSGPAEVARLLGPFCRGSDLIRLVQSVSEHLPGVPPNPVETESTRNWISNAPEYDDQPTNTYLPDTKSERSAALRPKIRLRWKAWTGIAVLVLLIVALSGAINQTPDPVDVNIPPPHNVWIDLLERQPRVVFNEGNPTDVDVHRMPGSGLLSLSSLETCLFQFGRTNAKSFVLEFTFLQNGWTGGVGVFWGYKPLPPPKQGNAFHYFELHPFEINRQDQTAYLLYLNSRRFA